MKDLKDILLIESENDVNQEDAKRELLPDDERYCVVQTGGSIGEQDRFQYRLGSERCSITRDNLTAEEAKEIAKRYRSYLTPGERKYYHITYKAVLATKLKNIS